MLLEVCGYLGRKSIRYCVEIGKITNFSIKIIVGIFKRPFYLNNLLQQIWHIGYMSLPIITLTSIFSGGVLALQSYNGFARISAESSIATVVVLSMTRELSPVLSGLMLAGRSGAGITSEIATMKVKDQIDALYTLATDPIPYLFVPRFLATIIMLPLLVLLADFVGVFGGYLIATNILDFNGSLYIVDTIKHLEYFDICLGLIKALIFGIIISIISCYMGYECIGGARGVGTYTKNAVVVSSILILLSNYLTTSILLFK